MPNATDWFTYCIKFDLNIMTTLTSTKRTSAISSRFIERPIKVVSKKVRNTPSVDSYIESRMISKEMKYLLEGFTTDKVVVGFRRANNLKLRTKTLYKRVSMLKRTNEVSFSEVAKRNVTSFGRVTVSYPSTPLNFMSRGEARRDYTRAYKEQAAQRRAAFELVSSIAARHPRVVRTERKSINLVDRKNLLEARRALRKERKQLRLAREVDSFPIGSYYSKPEVCLQSEQVEKDYSRSAQPTSVKQVKVRSIIRTNVKECFIGPRNQIVEIKDTKISRRSRLINLLSRTENGRALLICYMAVKITRNPKALDDIQDILSVEPQMDTESVEGQIPTNISKGGNVVVQEYNNIDKGTPILSSPGFVKNSVSTESQTYQQMTDRWVFYESFDWKTSDNIQLKEYILPRDFVKLYKIPNNQLLYCHALIRTGMKIKIQVNSNKFQVGQLIAGFTYGNSETHPNHNYINVPGLIQRNHILLQAGRSNDGELNIPYHYPDSAMRINKEELNMGKLTILVMNPLVVTESVAPSCRISVLMAFDNLELFGSVPRGQIYDSNFIEPQMDTVGKLCNVGGSVLSTIGSELNRDNPPYPLQPMSLVPQSTPSFSYMKRIPEPLNILRADPTGQTPHISQLDEMNPNVISRVWGYSNTFQWGTDQVSGTQLYTDKVSPYCKLSAAYIWKDKQEFAISQYPPVTVIASMFGYWRGDLEYKLQVVASAFHTGRLMIGVVPYSQNLVTTTLESLRCCPHQLIDIGEATEIIFRAPFYNRNAWARLKGSDASSKSEPLTNFFVIVVNPLIAIDSVSPNVYVNLFIRGAENFEVSIPRHPRFAPMWGPSIKVPATQFLHLYNKENKMYTTWNRNIPAGDKYGMTCYIDVVTDAWEGFTNVMPNVVYKLKDETTTGKKLVVPFISKGKAYKVKYGVADPGLVTGNAKGLLLCDSLAKAQSFNKAVAQHEDLSKCRAAHASIWEADSSWSTIEGKQATNNYDVEGYPQWELISTQGFELVEPQMDTSAGPPVVDLDVPVMPTSAGLLTFGEATPDLKDITRRWIHYASVHAKICIRAQPRDCPFTARVPIHPYRKLDPQSSASFDNRARQGSISLIGSAYLLWRGSMRFRFIVTGIIPDGTTIYVQHRFDEQCNSDTPQVELSKGVTTIKDLLSTHYATYMQALNVNSTLSIEVPYYQPQEGLYTVPCTKNHAYSNGKLYLWVHGVEEKMINIEIYYSMGDDARFSVWQGFPPLYDLSEFAPEPQMDDKPQKNGSLWESLKAPFTAAKKVEIVTADIHASAEKFNTMSDKISDLADSLNDIMKEKQSIATRFKSKVTKAKEQTIWAILTAMFGTVAEKMFSFVTHIVYAILAPTAATVAWSIINLYKTCFGFTVNGFEKLVTPLVNLYERIKTKMSSSKQPQKSQHNKPEPQGEDDQVYVGYVGLLFTSIASLCGVAATKPRDLQSVYKGLFSVSQSMKQGMFVTHFLRDNIELFKRITQKIVGLFGCKSDNYAMFAGVNDVRLRTWLVESQALLSYSKRDKLLSDPEWAQKIFELSIVGRGFLMCSLKKGSILSPVLDRHIKDISKQLQELERSLIQRKTFSPARYEPFCLWLAGQAGTMKTALGIESANSLAMKSGSKSSLYTITSGQAYFDGYSNQNSIMIDDFVTSSMSASPELYNQYLQMKSAALFNPPYARVEDKDRFINFQNLIITSNQLGIRNMPGILNEEAFNRRRDCLISFEHIDPSKSYKRYTQEERNSLAHVRCYDHRDVIKFEGSRFEILRVQGETYKETVSKHILDIAMRYHAQEMLLYQQRANNERELLNNLVSSGESLDDYLISVKEQFIKFDESTGQRNSLPLLTSCFARWVNDAKEAATIEGIEPQGNKQDSFKIFVEKYRSPQLWKTAIQSKTDAEFMECFGDEPELLTSPEDISEGELYEPIPRYSPFNGQIRCLHENFSIDMVSYNRKLGLLQSVSSLHQSHKIYSVPIESCVMRHEGKLILNPACIMMDKEKKYKFYEKIEEDIIKYSSSYSRAIAKFMSFGVIESSMEKAAEQFPFEFYNILDNKDDLNPIENKIFSREVDKQQSELKEEFEVVDGVALPIEPPKKSWTRKLWDGFKTFIKYLLKVLIVLSFVLGVIIFIVGLLGTAFLGAGYIQNKRYPEADPWLSVHSSEVSDEIRAKYMPNTPVSNMHPSGDFKTLKSAKTVRMRALNLVSNNMEPLSKELETFLAPNQNFERICQKIEKNVFSMVGLDNNGFRYVARCVGTHNKNFIVLKHYIEHFRASGVQEVKIVTHRANGMISYSIDDFDFKWTESGYGVGRLPSSFPTMFGNITRYMPGESFDQNYPRNIVIMETFYDKTIYHKLEATKFVDPLLIPSSISSSSWTIPVGFKYSWGGKGKCGSLILAPGMACPLIGIHTAGVGEKIGFSEILLKESFVTPQDPTIEFVTPNMEVSPNTYGIDGEYITVGTLDPQLSVVHPTETKIVPSEIYEVFSVETEPAPLHAMDPRLSEPIDPFSIGVSKRCNKSKEFVVEDIRLASADLSQLLNIKASPIRTPCKLSVKEAVEGMLLPGYEPIAMSTSEGYPWIKMRPPGFSDKSWLFNLSAYPDGRKLLEGINVDLNNVLEGKDKMRRASLVPATYYTACLKDARLLKSKVSIPGKTRIFEISPIDLTIAQRQYFMDFDVAYQTGRLSCEHTIGINPDGPEWSQLANSLVNFSKNILTADYSGYGPQLNHGVLLSTFDITNAWYGYHEDDPDSEEAVGDWLVREVLKYEISQGLHIARNTVFRPPCGLPSGNAETVIRNSLGNSLYIRLAYLNLARKNAPHLADFYWFKRYVLLYHNGDDLIMSVKDEIISWFNNETLIGFFANYGIKMTDALKSGKVRPFCPIEEATYLKRGFVRHPIRKGHWMAPLEKSSITDTANWVWKSVDSRSASLQNSEQSCRLAYTQGPKFYDIVCQTIQRAWSKKGVLFDFPSWESLDSHVWEGTEAPKYSF